MAGDKTATGRHIAARAEENPTVGGNNRNIFHRHTKAAHPKACHAYFMHASPAGNRDILNKFSGLK
ncbi:hypothetical protein N9W56_00950 [Alphaproteobacteria bacterium]|nr:hypothetical protein [Alphaproteobacteria bacterium]